MRFAIRLPLLLSAALLPVLWGAAAWAVAPSDSVLPSTTKGYLSVAQPAKLTSDWEKTQLGQMMDDPTMQPFVDDMKRQLDGKSTIVTERLGITWDDLDGVPAGELSLAIVDQEERPAALVMTIDVAGHAAQAGALISAVEKRLAERGATKKLVNRSGTELHVFDIPAAEGARAQQTVYFVHKDMLCGVDDRQLAETMLQRLDDPSAGESLRSLPAYVATMERCRREAKGLAPDVRWFVEPFGLVWAGRTLSTKERNPHDRDLAKILSEQGFDAVQGAGGYVNLLAPGGVEILYRTSVYAPPVAGKANDPLRWNLGMRMLQMPNVESLAPESWVPRVSANYTSFTLDFQAAYDNVSTLFDALKNHEGAFETSMRGLEEDAYGPKVNVRREFVENLGQRITIVTAYSVPITVDSERSLFAIEAKDQRALAQALEKWMSNDPNLQRREFNGVAIWERVPPEAAVQQLQIEAPGFSPLEMDAPEQTAAEEEDRERVLPNSASCVALGHLILASDIDFLREVLAGYGQREMLSTSADYLQVAATLDRLAPGPRSMWSFSRTDETYRPTYELIRQGKMPESETMLGKILNNLLTTEAEKQEGIPRKQEIDGGNLPSFEMVRRYFGPAGRSMRSERDGWFMTGALLDKEAP